MAYTHKPFDCVPCQRARYNPLRNRGIRGVVQEHVTRIVGISQALATALAHNGYPGVTPVHNGVDPDEYAPPDPAAVAAFREEHELGDRSIVLLAARLSGSKGAGQLVDAMAHVPGDATAVLLGHNPAYREKLARQAAQRGIAERVRFLGWLTPPAVKLAYFASDLVVAPSTYPDPFNLTLIEGMACGKPVIGSAFGAASEIIANGETGFVINPLDTPVLAQAITDLLRDPSRRHAFGTAGQARVRRTLHPTTTSGPRVEDLRGGLRRVPSGCARLIAAAEMWRVDIIGVAGSWTGRLETVRHVAGDVTSGTHLTHLGPESLDSQRTPVPLRSGSAGPQGQPGWR